MHGLTFVTRNVADIAAAGVSPLDPLTNVLFAGAWMAALLFPPIARFAALRGRVVPRIGPLVPRSWIA